MRFSINFFTSIGLGGLTDRMREHLKNLPRLIATQPAAASDSDSSSGECPLCFDDTVPMCTLMQCNVCRAYQDAVWGNQPLPFVAMKTEDI